MTRFLLGDVTLNLEYQIMTRYIALLVAVVLAPFARATDPDSAIEQKVSELVKGPDVTVVHLWATWCPNCFMEIKDGGWKNFVTANPDTKFVFASVWDDGKDGRAVLEKFGVASLPNVTVVADPGPRRGEKIARFLDTPVTWLPSTWIFKKGKLYYALNYGEIHFPILQQLVKDANEKWDRDSSIMK